MKRLLIVSPHFPPVNAPDMQRIRMSLPHYLANGWEVEVLCCRQGWDEASLDPELLATLPPGIPIHRVDPIPLAIARLFNFSNIGLRSLHSLFLAGCRLLHARPFDLVLFSTTQFIVFLLGPLWKFLLHTPFAIDLQDPWLTDYYEQPGARPPPGGWKYRFSKAQAHFLEPLVFRSASGFLSVSPGYCEDLDRRYPAWFPAKPRLALEFGASAEDLQTALASPHPPRPTGDSLLHVVYTGAAGPIMPDALNVLFAGLAAFRRFHPARATRFRFHFIGTSYASPSLAQPSVLPVAHAHGVAGLVEEIPARQGFLECLRHQAAADILLLPGSSDRSYSPSKLYNYYLAGRPILALAFVDSVMLGLLERLHCSRLVRIASPWDLSTPVLEIMRFLFDASLDFPPGTLPSRNDSCFHQHYLAAHLTARQAEFLHSIARR